MADTILRRHLILVVTTLVSLVIRSSLADDKSKGGVTYDGTSLIINGKRELLFSGSIHYTRSTPDMWPDLLQKSKLGGLNLIQTYVFWNVHEPVEGQLNFEGQYDVVKFIKMIAEHDMYVTLRVGPFIEAEWNHGGFPYWLRTVPGMTFRTNNEPFKKYMEKFVKMIIDMMKEEKLFASQGGPIILAQIENEYNAIEPAFKEEGVKYVQWSANLALNFGLGIPWIMCKQKDAPGEVINACNGRHCGDTFTGPNSPTKPSLWTENWTAQYRVFGDPPSQRAAEDIAFSVARWFSKNGSLANYYMYHGGTNFGRSTSSFVTTRYYDEAPLDEFGLQREPKYGHLTDLHRALKLCRKALLWGTPRTEKISEDLTARIYEQPGTGVCAAFLSNNNSKEAQTVNFKGANYFLPEHSISILPDCKNAVFNSMLIVSQHNSRNFVKSESAHKDLKWEMSKEIIRTQLPVNSKSPLELIDLTKDKSDYAWYTTSIELTKRDLPLKREVNPVMRIASLGHGMHAFVNGEYVGSAHGSNVEKSFVLQQSLNLQPGTNHISLLAYLVGLPDSGVYMERRYAGPRGVALLGLNTGTLDITNNGWGHQVGLDGEKVKAYTQGGSHRVNWEQVKGKGSTLTWYKTYFDAPEGKDPVAVKMTGMGKGMIWVNGKSIGRYWMSYLSPLKIPSQSEYHIPRSFIKSSQNLMVILEEEEVSPENIEIVTVNRNTICSYVTENHPIPTRLWEMKKNKLQTTGDDAKIGAQLSCYKDKTINAVEFASFGNPDGFCGGFSAGTCDSSNAKQVVEKYCIGKVHCSIPLEKMKLDKGNCQNVVKTIAIQARCG